MSALRASQRLQRGAALVAELRGCDVLRAALGADFALWLRHRRRMLGLKRWGQRLAHDRAEVHTDAQAYARARQVAAARLCRILQRLGSLEACVIVHAAHRGYAADLVEPTLQF